MKLHRFVDKLVQLYSAAGSSRVTTLINIWMPDVISITHFGIRIAITRDTAAQRAVTVPHHSRHHFKDQFLSLRQFERGVDI
ncbi:hypothetical protein E2P81_ATG09194 [Venturia nashicola]|uniref:Uncharacterized protein n=1 Tax=Venturia nashicola TaxID=86259 RepID=A0A4Z1NUB6_9PEZI|nr:hypothetical protein E6O75_ATG09394 [Venturia nashicola]TLD20124.1 hypothetical protein E2P81_ATG09194 [Venturia nashicola]